MNRPEHADDDGFPPLAQVDASTPYPLATAIQEMDGQTIRFFTGESCRQFNDDPSYYLGTRFGSTVEPGCTVSVSPRSES